MTSFKELLTELGQDTKKSVWQRRKRFDKKELNAYLEGKSIEYQKFVLMLGEWAWKEFASGAPDNIPNYVSRYDYVQMAYKKINKQNYPGFWILLEISIACLGEEEVKKRLEELSK